MAGARKKGAKGSERHHASWGGIGENKKDFLCKTVSSQIRHSFLLRKLVWGGKKKKKTAGISGSSVQAPRGKGERNTLGLGSEKQKSRR